MMIAFNLPSDIFEFDIGKFDSGTIIFVASTGVILITKVMGSHNDGVFYIVQFNISKSDAIHFSWATWAGLQLNTVQAVVTCAIQYINIVKSLISSICCERTNNLELQK